MNININAIKEWFKLKADVGMMVAGAIISFSIWWFNTDNRFSLSFIVAPLLGAAIIFVLVKIVGSLEEGM